MNKITHRIPGKWELGLFKDAGHFLAAGTEYRAKGYKRMPIKAAYLDFTPPNGHIWYFENDGGKWNVKPGRYYCYVLRGGVPFIEIPAGDLEFENGGSVIIPPWHPGGRK